MNDDLISREALKKHITEIFETEEKIDKKWAMGLKYSLKIINNAPTVDTTFNEVVAYECGQKSVERPQGKWKGNNFGEHSCPLCGHPALYEEEPDGYYEVQSNFCPFCVADMQKGSAE